MKCLFAGAVAALCLAGACERSFAQDSPQTAGSPQESAQPTPKAPADSKDSKSQVLFHRSIGENGETTETGAAAEPVIQAADAPAAEDAERRAVTFTDLDLDVHLRSAEQQIAVRAQMTVRNDGKTPLARIPLQISSSLKWEEIRADGKAAAFTVAAINSDTDHTGQLAEAVAPLATALAPGASARLDVTYSGTIALDARRLLAVGTPEETALHSDWDRISTAFIGLRGFGNVAWYPVASVPAILGDGARVFDEIGEQKRRLKGARFRLRLAMEFPPGQAPDVALVNGSVAALTVTEGAASGGVSGVATANVESATLGFEAPSLFLAQRAKYAGTEMTVWTQPADSQATEAWVAAASGVMPFLQGWLGQRPRSPLNVVDLPDAQDAPFETGSMLAVPVRAGAQEQLQNVLVHALTHAYLRDDARPLPAWLDEGVATLLGTLWVERQRGRTQALGVLEASRDALALAEPASPGEGTGHPLSDASSPVYYRTKAAYVLWMLRDLAGEQALSAALRGLAASSASARGESFEKLLAQADGGRDLSWFFADWVDSDKGLPDLSIESVIPLQTKGDSWIAAVNVANNGHAAVEAPITVRAGEASVTERILIPARGKASRRVLIQGKPTEVQLNDGTIPETQASVHVKQLN